MKKLIALIAAVLILLALLCGCHGKEMRSEPIDCRYTAAYNDVETTYDYKYDIVAGDFRLMPDTHTVHHDEQYEILYRITYEDGTTGESWLTVSRQTYQSFEKENTQAKAE